jgi:hypothetical protein
MAKTPPQPAKRSSGSRPATSRKATAVDDNEAPQPQASRRTAPGAPIQRDRDRDRDDERMKVRATAEGYYDDVLRREGDVFTIDATPRADDPTGMPAVFSDVWMEEVDPQTRERVTTPNQMIQQAHDETLKQRHDARTRGGTSTGDAAPLGDD